MDATTLAAAFAARLREVLPDGFAAVAEGENVRICPPDGYDVWVGIVQDLTETAGYEIAASNVLSTAQDVVSESTAMPWPRARGEALDLALPGCRCTDGMLQLWFGDEGDPVLPLRPIDVTR